MEDGVWWHEGNQERNSKSGVVCGEKSLGGTSCCFSRQRGYRLPRFMISSSKTTSQTLEVLEVLILNPVKTFEFASVSVEKIPVPRRHSPDLH